MVEGDGCGEDGWGPILSFNPFCQLKMFWSAVDGGVSIKLYNIWHPCSQQSVSNCTIFGTLVCNSQYQTVCKIFGTHVRSMQRVSKCKILYSAPLFVAFSEYQNIKYSAPLLLSESVSNCEIFSTTVRNIQYQTLRYSAPLFAAVSVNL